MIEWKERINIKDIYDDMCDNKVSVSVGAVKIAERLKTSSIEPQLQGFIKQLNGLTASSSENDFDIIMQDVFDFCDEEHRIKLRSY